MDRNARLCGAGLGVALVPALALRARPTDIALVPLDPDDASVRQLFAASIAGRSRRPAVTAFLARLRAGADRLGSVSDETN